MKMRTITKTTLRFICLLCLLLPALPAMSIAPNVVIFIADDQGMGISAVTDIPP